MGTADSGRGALIPRLRYCRQAAALTQTQLAARAKVSASVVAKLEALPDTRRADMPTLRKLADALGVTAAELMRAD